MAAMAINGRPTAVMQKPKMATGELLPAIWPMCTGKIRFPAPKNNPNSRLATAAVSLTDSLRFIHIPSFRLSAMCGLNHFEYTIRGPEM